MGKVWLVPEIRVAYLHGFTAAEERLILETIASEHPISFNAGMTTSNNNYDAIEGMIYSTGLRISSLEFYPELDLMVIVLNSGKVLRQSISYSDRLPGLPKTALENYRFVGGGVGVHWPDADEDLSLKGFLLDELKRIAGESPDRALAA